MSKIWKAGDQIPKHYHELGDEVQIPPINASRLTMSQRLSLMEKVDDRIAVLSKLWVLEL